jgi:uncharacterized membrane protein
MFYKNRPKLIIEKTEFDRLTDWLSIIILVVFLIYVFLKYQHLPNIIPTHFGADGAADDFGPKITIWILPSIAIILIIVKTILIKYPHLFNYSVKITEENAPRLYQFGAKIVRLTTLFVTLLFFYLSYVIIKTTEINGENTLGTWFAPTIIVFSFSFFIYLLIKMNSLK